MRTLLRASLLLACCAALCPAQDGVQKRVTRLEKRVTSVEKRVTRLEKGRQAPAAKTEKAAEMPAEPVAVSFLRKQQVFGQERAGMRLYVEFENVSNRRLYAFDGTLVFRNEKGAVIWNKAYGHSEPLGPGEKVQVSFGLLTDQAKAYLAFVRASKVTVELTKQEAYGAQ